MLESCTFFVTAVAHFSQVYICKLLCVEFSTPVEVHSVSYKLRIPISDFSSFELARFSHIKSTSNVAASFSGDIKFSRRSLWSSTFC